MNTIKVPIRGMHCASCEVLIGESVRKVPGVDIVTVNHRRSEAVIQYRGAEPSAPAIRRAVQDAGYEVGQKNKLPWLSSNPRDYKDLLCAAGILFIIYLIAKWLNLFNLDVGPQNTGVIVALFVGLVAGVSTCMALVGGLVLSLSARHAERHPEATPLQKFRPHLYLNTGRILGYAILGGLTGLVGAAFRPSTNVLGFLTVVIGVVMLFFGLKLVEIFPVLKDKSITLPTGLAKIFGLHQEVKEYSPKSSLVMGALTFFLPCGFTQAMQLYAVSTGSFWQGMAIMGLFALGTAPGLLGIGSLTSIFTGRKARVFFMTAGLAVIILGWTNIVNGGRLFGGGARDAKAAVSNGEAQEVRMTQSGGGYSPNAFTVEKG
ncbi:MAG: sulfite exporter TauE/SafE family protein, partial [Candidatus Magasanikbacteria bacterium]|nr:sulfite exporter TauE/SafE family protein [Candidatus Magasanikbacteria bacterium]